jgi:hypothetical protein
VWGGARQPSRPIVTRDVVCVLFTALTVGREYANGTHHADAVITTLKKAVLVTV